jgi:molybdopterin-guanine dinucleotide biosynthesis protein B
MGDAGVGSRQDLEQHAPVVGFVGPSGVGKTSLLERLIPALARHGLSVGVLKHASHGFLADRPGKDSHRLYESGADAVALISREQVASFARRAPGAGEEVSLAAALASLPRDLDLVLAEGFSWEPIPRIVLVRRGEAPAREHGTRGQVLEIVRVPDSPQGARPVFPEALIESLAGALAARVPGDREARRGLAEESGPSLDSASV